ncbi:MAG: hypothetical protein JNM24_11255 [Bdellovibrionaceae bacterium]|nr:hypothetical protein [Pseudobdellovibrionaceae bacterium]
MKKRILILFLVAVQSFGADVLRIDSNFGGLPFTFSKKSYSDNGDLNVGYFVSCRPERQSLCQELCSAQTCLISNDSCEACVSSRNLNVFALFNDFSKLFTLSRGTVDWVSLFEKIKNEGVRVVDENAILNLFEDTQSDEKYESARKRFFNSCPADTAKAFLLIDGELNPLVYVCQGSYGQISYQTQWNTEIAQ